MKTKNQLGMTKTINRRPFHNGLKSCAPLCLTSWPTFDGLYFNRGTLGKRIINKPKGVLPC